MSVPTTSATGQEVVLLRLGVVETMYEWSPGLTLADLLREANATAEDFEIYLDGKPLAESVVLGPGTNVVLHSRPDDQPTAEAWQKGIGDFHDDPAFEEMMQSVELARQAEKEQP